MCEHGSFWRRVIAASMTWNAWLIHKKFLENCIMLVYGRGFAWERGSFNLGVQSFRGWCGHDRRWKYCGNEWIEVGFCVNNFPQFRPLSATKRARSETHSRLSLVGPELLS